MKSKNVSKITKLLILVFFLQFLLVFAPLTPNVVSASPYTYPDSVWEGPDYDFGTALNLGTSSVKNDPNTPLNVSTLDQDLYRFDVYTGFYFSIFLEFNQTNVYDTNGQLFTYSDPELVADIDIKVTANNGTTVGVSNGNGNEEGIGPVYITQNDIFFIEVTAEKPFIGYQDDYSTTYNMSVVQEDQWEVTSPNDKIDEIDDPRDGASDDEILPGSYSNLRFSLTTGFSDFNKQDWYCIWFYKQSEVTLTVASFVDPGNPEPDGPWVYVYDEQAIDGNLNDIAKFEDMGANDIDTLSFQTPYDGWYYLLFDNSYLNTVNYYQLNITIEDSLEVEAGGNDVNASAIGMIEGHHSGLVISSSSDDWYKVSASATERILIDLKWFSFIGDLQMTLYENETAAGLIGAGVPIFGGLRIGPHRANKDLTYLIHITGDNTDPRYYNLTIAMDEIDDWAEDNDDIFHPYLLPSISQEIRPTPADPFGGLFSQEGDLDFYVISLLSGDHLTIIIEFNNTLGDLDLALATADGTIIDSSALSLSNTETVSFMAWRTDVYYIGVAGKAGSYATIGVEYNMSIVLAEFDDAFESNDNAQTAAPIAEGDYSEMILRDKDDDWYYVYLVSSDIIEINLTYVAGTWGVEEYLNDIDLDLLFDDQSLAAQSRTLFNETLSFTATRTGKYYIVCVIDGLTNQYNLSIDILETDDVYEDNDYLAQATQVSFIDTNNIPDEPVTHPMSNLQMRVKDDDFYVTNLPAGLAIIVEVTFGQGQNLDLELLYPNGSVIDSSYLTASTAETVGPFPMNQTYTDVFNSTDIYFRVLMNEGEATSYELRITIGPEEILITRETVPTFVPYTPTVYKPSFLDTIIPMAAGGAIIGGGGAAVIYAGKKTGAIDKGVGAIRDRLGGKGDSGGTGDTPKSSKRSRRKPPP